MRATFSGIEVSVIIDHGVRLCGVRGAADDHILFQRGETEMSPTSLHFEYRNQGTGGYDYVRECRLSRRLLSIDLSKQLRAFPGMTGIDIALEIDEPAYHRLAAGLLVLFTPCPERLVAG